MILVVVAVSIAIREQLISIIVLVMGTIAIADIVVVTIIMGTTAIAVKTAAIITHINHFANDTVIITEHTLITIAIDLDYTINITTTITSINPTSTDTAVTAIIEHIVVALVACEIATSLKFTNYIN